MKVCKTAMMVLALALVSGSSLAAAPEKSAHPQAPASLKAKKPGTVKLLDINSANKAELMKLNGIHAVEAEKLIAGRPYGSKAWLVSHKIISLDVYLAIKDRIIARQDQGHGVIIKTVPAVKARPGAASR